MKKLLGWAFFATLLVMGLYLGLFALGIPSNIVLPLVVCAVACLGFASFFSDGLTGIAAIVVVTGFAFAFAVVDLITFAAALVLAFIGTVFAFVAANDLKIKFKHVFTTFMIEGLGIYGTLALSTWWPATLAVLILGVWWLWLHAVEKKEVPAIIA